LAKDQTAISEFIHKSSYLFSPVPLVYYDMLMHLLQKFEVVSLIWEYAHKVAPFPSFFFFISFGICFILFRSFFLPIDFLVFNNLSY